MTGPTYRSWGLTPQPPQQGVRLQSRSDGLPGSSEKSVLPYGNGRSYGDSCLNDSGLVVDCRSLNRVIGFDEERGVICCEAGMLLADLLEIIVPSGWFLPVTPGTKFVTLGGAIANDVHGKNHHVRGTFGNHVTAFELRRSGGPPLICTRRKNAEWFAATVGGMGLTGLITWAELKLTPIQSPGVNQETLRFRALDEFIDLARESDHRFEYSVAWVDSLARGSALGRGLFIRGNHAGAEAVVPQRRTSRLSVPLLPPVSLINRATLTVFNALYYRRQLNDRSQACVHYDPFFYPLDRVAHWNRLYGPKGLLQHQCVVPPEDGISVVTELIERTQRAGIGSFLTVLKMFGDVPSPGLMSFPMSGLTLTLDFANQGQRTTALLDELDAVVRQARGRVNPYKDARMSAESFADFFPQWQRLEPFIDPRFSSSFWRRVTRGARRGGTTADLAARLETTS